MARDYYRGREIKALHLFLTSLCNMRCPDCCMNIPRIKGWHLDLEEVERAGRLLHGIEHLYVTGGEPTMHPRFAEIVPRLRGLFGCQKMSLATNGFKVREYKELLPLFDEVLISHYEDNVEEAAFVSEVHVDNRAPGPTRHLWHLRRATLPAPCFRALRGVAFAHGRLHPCCVAKGPDAGIPLGEDWRSDILTTALPCADCCFAEERDSPAGVNVLNALEPGEHLRVDEVFADGWMGREMIVNIPATLLRCASEQGSSLGLSICSHGPSTIHPLRLEVHGQKLERSVLEIPVPGEFEWQLPMPHVTDKFANGVIRVIASDTFNPGKLYGEENNDRELSVLIARISILRA